MQENSEEQSVGGRINYGQSRRTTYRRTCGPFRSVNMVSLTWSAAFASFIQSCSWYNKIVDEQVEEHRRGHITLKINDARMPISMESTPVSPQDDLKS